MAEGWGIVPVFLRVYGFGDSTFAELLLIEGPKGKGPKYPDTYPNRNSTSYYRNPTFTI